MALRAASSPALSSFSMCIGWPMTNCPRANGFGIINRSHPLARQYRSTDQHIGTMGLPAICAIDTGPAAKIRAGPRGPSGVMATECPLSRTRFNPRKPDSGLRFELPQTVLTPKHPMACDIMRPSACGDCNANRGKADGHNHGIASNLSCQNTKTTPSFWRKSSFTFWSL